MGSKYINRTVGNFFIGILFCNKIFLLNPTVSWVASWDSSNSIRWIPDKNAKSVLPGNYRTTLSVSWCETFISVFFACGLVIPVFIVFPAGNGPHDKQKTRQKIVHDTMPWQAVPFCFPRYFYAAWQVYAGNAINRVWEYWKCFTSASIISFTFAKQGRNFKINPLDCEIEGCLLS